MSPLQQFMRWLKERTGQKDGAKMAKIRKLPPIPDGIGDDYGFRRHDDASSHIYEEIYDSPTTTTSSGRDGHRNSPTANVRETEFITRRKLQHLDFQGAETVGPYLVVPIKKKISKKSDRHNLDLLADLKNDENVKIDSRDSLFNMMPDWAKEHLKLSAGTKQGLPLSKGYSVDEPPSKYRHKNGREHDVRTQLATVTQQNSTDTPTFIVHRTLHGGPARNGDGNGRIEHGNCRSAHGDIRIEKPSESRSSTSVYNEYQVPKFDSTKEDYEYFLIKTQKNLRIERELRDYLSGTPSTVTTDGLSPSDETQFPTNPEETRDVLIIAKREAKQRKSSDRMKPSSKQPNEERQSLDVQKQRYQRAADALLDQIYSTASIFSEDIHLPSSPDALATFEESRFERFDTKRTDLTTRETNSIANLDDSKLSCRVTDFRLGAKAATDVKNAAHSRGVHRYYYYDGGDPSNSLDGSDGYTATSEECSSSTEEITGSDSRARVNGRRFLRDDVLS